LSQDDRPDPIRLALDIPETGLADRLVAILADVPDIRLVRAGEVADAVIVSPATDAGVASTAPGSLTPPVSLTPREVDVLALLAQGASNKMIARALGISVHTAKFHVGSLIDKLDATGRTDAVAHAARLGVIHL